MASISDYTIGNTTEFTIQLKKDANLTTFAETIQKIIWFLQKDFLHPVSSYNLFFYEMDHIFLKICPRYLSSPLYVGYQLTPTLADKHINEVLKRLRSPIYFGD